jgi:hypothetical protein
MENFKVTLDRIEEGNAVLLIRDDESIKINIPLFLLPAPATYACADPADTGNMSRPRIPQRSD